MFGCLFEIVETLVLTLIIFLVIQTFVAQPYKVQQQSMEHTLEPDQYVLVDKLTPRFDTYKRGDIVVFSPPPDWSREDDDAVHQAGHRPRRRHRRDPRRRGLHQRDQDRGADYLFAAAPGDPTQPTTVPGDEHRWVIPAGELFLMGDHRSNSADSRMFGPVETEQVIGRAWLRYWPLDVFGILPTPTYPELAPTPS